MGSAFGVSRRIPEKAGCQLVVPRSRLASATTAAARRLGIDRLYPEQQQALDAVLAGGDVLMVLPTGFGKSACYQIPSMLLRQPVVVVSPLLALLRDQQSKLEQREIPCVRLDGTLRGPRRREALERLAQGGPLLVLTTPETLEAEDLQAVLGKTGIGLVAVDEAHCISEWGHDFRPSYARIGVGLAELGTPTVLALTATATPRIRQTIVRSLAMRRPQVVAGSPHRSNLAFEVIGCEGDRRLRALVRLVRRLRRPGIVYCATRREVDGVHQLLCGLGLAAYRYHGRMSAKDRQTEQQRFMRPRHRSVMVATSAFGLGIDRRDIRYVLHYQSPASLEQYVQEAGRAGRDGKKANCLLLADPSDRAIHEALQARSRIRPQQIYSLGRALAAWAGEGRSPSLEALAVSAGMGERVAAALLVKLEEARLVARANGEIQILAAHDSVADRARSLAGQLETLRIQDSRRLDSINEYMQHAGCRATYLRDYFGETGDERCELCDNCRGRSARPDGFFEPLARASPRDRRGPRATPPARGKRRRRRRRRGATSQSAK